MLFIIAFLADMMTPDKCYLLLLF